MIITFALFSEIAFSEWNGCPNFLNNIFQVNEFHGNWKRIYLRKTGFFYPFWANLAPKIVIASWRSNLTFRLIGICWIGWWCWLFMLWNHYTLFRQKLAQNVKIKKKLVTQTSNMFFSSIADVRLSSEYTSDSIFFVSGIQRWFILVVDNSINALLLLLLLLRRHYHCYPFSFLIWLFNPIAYFIAEITMAL